MNKTTMALAFGLALSAGAGALQAQAPAQGARRGSGEHGQFEGRRGGGPERALLKGIKLSADQKAKLKTVFEQDRAQRQANRPDSATIAEIRAARQRGDTTAARAKMQQLRAQMEKNHEQRIAQIRAILTPDQQKQFDANVAEMKQRMAQREKDGGPGWGGHRGGQHGPRGNGQGFRPGGAK